LSILNRVAVENILPSSFGSLNTTVLIGPLEVMLNYSLTPFITWMLSVDASGD